MSIESMSDMFWTQDMDLMKKFVDGEQSWRLGWHYLFWKEIIIWVRRHVSCILCPPGFPFLTAFCRRRGSGR